MRPEIGAISYESDDDHLISLVLHVLYLLHLGHGRGHGRERSYFTKQFQ